MLKSWLLLPCIFLSTCLYASPTPLSVLDLRCDYRTNPFGIDQTNPGLSWKLACTDNSTRGLKQTAYQLLIASASETLDADKGDFWDSGKVVSDQSVHIKYAGKVLLPGCTYYWKVRVWDNDDKPSGWSDAATFTTGIPRLEDWHAQWIGASSQPMPIPSGSSLGYHAALTPENQTKWVQVDLGKSYSISNIVLHPITHEGIEGFAFPVRFRIDISDDAAFGTFETIADNTEKDYPNPGGQKVSFDGKGKTARYVRVTAAKSIYRPGDKNYIFALDELQVFSGSENVSVNKPVAALDSVEQWGWSAQSLTDNQNLVPGAGSNGSGYAAIMLRKEFQTPQSPVRATAFICGLGLHELYINGQRIGGRLLEPPFTDFNERVIYSVYDVTTDWRTGTNAIGVMLGNGWYHMPTDDLFHNAAASWRAAPKLLLHVRLEFSDGTLQQLVSDESWKWSTGPITFNCIRAGEDYDARLEKNGWTNAGYDDRAWNKALTVSSPAGKLTAQTLAPVRRTLEQPAKNVTVNADGSATFDFGRNIAGWSRLKVSGKAGQKISISYPGAPSHTRGRYQTDTYTLKGKGTEVWEPRFTHHGFDKAIVTGLSGTPTPDMLTAVFVHTDLTPAGDFTCSNPKLNEALDILKRTTLNYVLHFPADPVREKMGWTQDVQTMMPTSIYMYDSAHLYQGWFADMIDFSKRRTDGYIGPIIPVATWCPLEWNGPWWAGVSILLPWWQYQYYGDTEILRSGYPVMKGFLDYLTRYQVNRDGLIEWGLGDWMEVGANGRPVRTPQRITSTCAYYFYADIVSKTAALLGKTDDAQTYSKLAQNIKNNFNHRLYDNASGLYGNASDSQTACAIPLYTGIVPQDQIQRVTSNLVENIKQRDYHISTGFVGTPVILMELNNRGHQDVAYKMVTNPTYPGWMDLIYNRKVTTYMEDWQAGGVQMPSLNGPIGQWLYAGLAGIQPDPAAVGFKKFIIKPAFNTELTWVNAHFESMYGRITSNWRRDNNAIHLDVTVPANTSATVYIPFSKLDDLTEGQKQLKDCEGIKLLKTENNTAVLNVASGTYSFDSKLIADN